MKKNLFIIAMGILGLNVNAQTQFIGVQNTTTEMLTSQFEVPSSNVSTTPPATNGGEITLPVNGTYNFEGFSNFTGTFNVLYEAVDNASSTSSDFIMRYYRQNGLTIYNNNGAKATTDVSWLKAANEEILSMTFSGISTAGTAPDLRIISFTVSHVNATGESVQFTNSANSDVYSSSTIDAGSAQVTTTLTTPIPITNNLKLSFKALGTTLARVTGFTVRDFNQPLPVKVSSFNAKPSADDIAVNWTTSSEQNNSYFNVLRAGADKNFINIGRVNGAGTSNGANTYSFIDKAPLAGANYYNLEQVDFDGKSETFGPVSANFSLNSNNAFSVSRLANSNKLAINLTSEIKSKASLAVYNLSGQRMLNQDVQLENGINSLQLNGNLLNQGIYIMVIESGDKSFRSKFIY